MSKQGRDRILEAAAKSLAWELYAAAGYGRTRTRVCIDRFDRQLRSLVREWNVNNRNLTTRKEK